MTTGQRAAALYARVAASRQVGVDPSIRDQIKLGEEFCATHNIKIKLVEIFVDRGASGVDDHRPEFQRMIDAAISEAHPFDLILVRELSRFFRDPLLNEIYVRRLRKAGVVLRSITEDLPYDTNGNLILQIPNPFRRVT
jgi:site-specific DNA recombinase